MGQKISDREDRLRRVADLQGLRLLKSPQRDPNATDFGTYMLVDVQHGGAVFADWDSRDKAYGLDLDAIEEWLTKPALRVVRGGKGAASTQPPRARRKGKK